MQPERSLPGDSASEHVIIGAVLNYPSLIESVRGDLLPAEMSVPSNQKIYSAMLTLHENDSEISPQMISAETGGEIGIAQISNMAVGVPAFSNLKPYITRIKNAAQRRWTILFAEHLQEMAYADDETPEEILTFAANQIDGAKSRDIHTRQVPASLEEMLDDQAMRYRLWHQGISNAVPTGFAEIDNNLLGGGLVRSGLYILAARPSMGKTSLALDITANVAAVGTTVYFVSREMPRESLFDRLHSAAAGIARWKLRPGIWESEYRKLIATLPLMAALPIVLDNQSLTVSDVRRSVKGLKRQQREPGLMVVDYVQLMRADGKYRSRNDEVGAVTRALKGMAMELDIPILALSQLSRDCEKNGREPETFDLRDSGEIEQDADAVVFLFGDKPEEGSRFYARTFKCAKQRDGALFRQNLTFNGELVTFRSPEQLALAGIQEAA